MSGQRRLVAVPDPDPRPRRLARLGRFLGGPQSAGAMEVTGWVLCGLLAAWVAVGGRVYRWEAVGWLAIAAGWIYAHRKMRAAYLTCRDVYDWHLVSHDCAPILPPRPPRPRDGSRA